MNIVYAKDWIHANLPDGSARRFPPGSHWPADDPYVRANPDSFSNDPRYHLAFTQPRDFYLDPSVPYDAAETATAAPGERRGARRPS